MKRTAFSIAFLAAGIIAASAQDFFSSGAPASLFTFGARIGFNTSNRTISDDVPANYHHESWGTGFDLGAVVNLNIKNYIAIQPGFFFESRNGGFTYNEDIDESSFPVTLFGTRHSYNFTIPLMGIVRFNVVPKVRWQVEAGPYIAFNLSSSVKDKSSIDSDKVSYVSKTRPVNWGVKLGTSFLFLEHVYLGAHYMAGIGNPWEKVRLANGLYREFGGLDKAWVFTLGYDF